MIIYGLFLKKTNNKKGTYLQIYESFYDPKRRQTAHKSYKPIGYVHELIEKGIDDPIAYYRDEVSELNKKFHAEKNEKKIQKIADKTPEKFLGYFPAKNINDSLSAKKYIDLMQTSTDFRLNIYEMISAPVYSRLVCPCSKSKTFDEVDPIVGLGLLLDADQIPIGMKLFPGNESEKPVIRKVIDDLKHRNSVTGRTIRIADKGLNYAENIAHALREKRVVSFNPKLAQKQIFEINREVEKAKLLKASQAKKSEYGDCAKYVTFSSTDKNGNETDGKVKVTINQKLIDKSASDKLFFI